MKAHRNVGGQVVEIDIDLDLAGRPILPPDTTIDPRPAALEGHYTTVVGNSWVQIPVPVQVVTLESTRTAALGRFDAYRKWLLDQPVAHESVLFDGDATARERLTQSVAVANAGGQVPPSWVTFDNGSFALASKEELTALMLTVMTAFGMRFATANLIRDAILAASTIEAVNDIEIPAPDTMLPGIE